MELENSPKSLSRSFIFIIIMSAILTLVVASAYHYERQDLVYSFTEDTIAENETVKIGDI